MRIAVIAALSVALTACHPSPAPVPPDASDAAPPIPPLVDGSPPPSPPADGGPCASWCASWRARGCKEGAPNCEAVCAHVLAAKLAPLNPAVCTKGAP